MWKVFSLIWVLGMGGHAIPPNIATHMSHHLQHRLTSHYFARAGPESLNLAKGKAHASQSITCRANLFLLLFYL